MSREPAKLNPTLAISSWRFPADNPEGTLPIDGAEMNHILSNGMWRKVPSLMPLACALADWMDECRAAALGG